jgi:hypothetical protein
MEALGNIFGIGQCRPKSEYGFAGFSPGHSVLLGIFG